MVIPGIGLGLRGGLAGCDGPKEEEVDDLELQVRTVVRMRKQKPLDDLTAQVAQLNKEKHQIGTNININAQHYLGIQAANSVPRTQVAELSHRLDSLQFLGCHQWSLWICSCPQRMDNQR